MRALHNAGPLRVCAAATAGLLLVAAAGRWVQTVQPFQDQVRSAISQAALTAASRSSSSVTANAASGSVVHAGGGGAAAGGGSAGDNSCFQPPRIVEPLQGNPLWDIFRAQRKGPVIRKWSPYLDIYHRYFQRFRGQQPNILEIGVQFGGSINMWRSYFGSGVRYYGLEVNPYCQELFHAPPDVHIVLGDQGSRGFWRSFRRQLAAANVTFDIILDDGGHEMQQQIVTYEEAWPLLKDGGVYICEDTSTSMDTVEAVDYTRTPTTAAMQSGPRYGGGYKRAGTWVEYAKQFADTLNGHYVNQTAHPDFDPLKRRDSVLSAAFYDQMVVLEKGSHPLAHEIKAGSFLMPIGARLQDEKVIPEVLAQYRQQLAKSLA